MFNQICFRKTHAILILVAEIKVSDAFYHIDVQQKFRFLLAHSRELVQQSKELG